MLKLGNWNELVIVRFTDHGAYLDGGDVGEVLMPKSYVLREMHPGDRVRVFVYLDQSERLVATTEQPRAVVGQFACLRVLGERIWRFSRLGLDEGPLRAFP